MVCVISDHAGLHHEFLHFHVRTFCFLSGLVAGDAPSLRSLHNLTFRLVLPLLLWCLLLDPIVFHTDPLQVPSRATWAGKVFGNIFHAGMHEFPYLWYLYALVCWRLWGFLLAPLRPSARVLAAVAASALGGYADLRGVFKLDYAVACFPIFVLGQVLGPELPMPALLGTACAMGFLAAIFALQTEPTLRAFQRDVPIAGWAHLVTDFCEPASMRLLWLRGLWKNTLELTKGLLFLACCPRSSGLISKLGRHTLYPYLLHPVAMHWFDQLLAFLPHELHSAWKHAAAPCLLTAVLASWPVRAVLGVFLEPSWAERWLAARRELGGRDQH